MTQEKFIEYRMDKRMVFVILAPFVLVIAAVWIILLALSFFFPVISLGSFEIVTGVNGLASLGALSVLGILVAWLWAHLKYYYFSYELHDEALYIRYGTFTRHREVIPYNIILNINTERNVFERVVGLCTLVIEVSAGPQKRTYEATIPGVYNRDEVVSEILKRKHRVEIEIKEDKEKLTKKAVDTAEHQEGVLKQILEEIKGLRTEMSSSKKKSSKKSKKEDEGIYSFKKD